jgi:hypothetical protein
MCSSHGSSDPGIAFKRVLKKVTDGACAACHYEVDVASIFEEKARIVWDNVAVQWPPPRHPSSGVILDGDCLREIWETPAALGTVHAATSLRMAMDHKVDN